MEGSAGRTSTRTRLEGKRKAKFSIGVSFLVISKVEIAEEVIEPLGVIPEGATEGNPVVVSRTS